jgi:retinol-binding protein 3
MMFSLVLAAAIALSPSQIDNLLTNVEHAFRAYVFPDVATRAVTMLKSNTPRYELISNSTTLTQTIDADLLAVTHDKHIKLHYAPEPPRNDKSPEPISRHASEQIGNFGFLTLRRLPGNVGYLDLDYFSDDPAVGQTINASMAFLANTDALIIDLRNNGGGSTVALQTLEAYFFNYQQQITSLEWRDPDTGAMREDQQFTASAVPGPLYLNKPVYILTSGVTFSCAEQFAYDLHNLKRATLVGETTGGGANPGDFIRVGEGFAVFMPEGRAYSPVTKTNWEGTGIAPDVKTARTKALVTAYDAALIYLKSHAKDTLELDEILSALADPTGALTAPH